MGLLRNHPAQTGLIAAVIGDLAAAFAHPRGIFGLLFQQGRIAQPQIAQRGRRDLAPSVPSISLLTEPEAMTLSIFLAGLGRRSVHCAARLAGH